MAFDPFKYMYFCGILMAISAGIVFDFPQEAEEYYFPGPGQGFVDVAGHTTQPGLGVLITTPITLQLGNGKPLTPPAVKFTLSYNNEGVGYLSFTARVPALTAGSQLLTATISSANDSNSPPSTLTGAVNINIIFISTSNTGATP
jgi:hypothetical protein